MITPPDAYLAIDIADRVAHFLSEHTHMWCSVNYIAASTYLVPWQVEQQLQALGEQVCVSDGCYKRQETPMDDPNLATLQEVAGLAVWCARNGRVGDYTLTTMPEMSLDAMDYIGMHHGAFHLMVKAAVSMVGLDSMFLLAMSKDWQYGMTLNGEVWRRVPSRANDGQWVFFCTAKAWRDLAPTLLPPKESR